VPTVDYVECFGVRLTQSRKEKDTAVPTAHGMSHQQCRRNNEFALPFPSSYAPVTQTGDNDEPEHCAGVRPHLLPTGRLLPHRSSPAVLGKWRLPCPQPTSLHLIAPDRSPRRRRHHRALHTLPSSRLTTWTLVLSGAQAVRHLWPLSLS
jgi:hypothetical protein